MQAVPESVNELRADLARQMLEQSPLPVCWADADARIHYANPAFTGLIQRDQDRYLGLSLNTLLSHEGSAGWADSFARVQRGELSRERGVLEIDGRETQLEIVYSALRDGSHDLVCLVVTRMLDGMGLSPQIPLHSVIDEAAVGIFVNDRFGRVHYANQAACRLLGYTLEELQALSITDIDMDFNLPELRDRIRKLHEQFGEAIFQTHHRRKDGSEYLAEVTVNTSRSKYKDFIISFFRDITSVHEQATKKEQLSFLVENASDAVYIFDEHRNIIYANRQASIASGYGQEELKGMNIAQLDPGYPNASPETFQKMAARGERIVFETEHVTRGGQRVPVEVSLAVSIFDGKIYNSAFVRDIRDRKEYLREMEEFRFALENTSDAIYVYGRDGAIRYANWAACEALGYSKEELRRMRVSDLDPRFDVLRVGRLWDNPTSARFAPLQTRHRRKDGSTYPVEIVVSATVLDGREYAVSFVRDITDRLQAQKALKEGEERFRIIADTSPVALMMSRVADGRILYANRQASSLFEKSVDELKASSLFALFAPTSVESELLDSLHQGKRVSNREILLDREDDAPLWLSLNTDTIELQGERVMCSAFLDVTEAKELSNQLSYHATYDDLTGLVNRREFEDRLQEVIELAQKHKTENALCYLDLDQFKIINDTCGHMAGDELLRQLSQVLFQCVRHDDTLARLGGDEFAILLEHCTLDNAEQVANKVRQVVQEFRFLWQGKTFNISVSIGLVPIAHDGESISDVLRRADAACYAAKETGRNRIHIFRFNDEELARRQGEMQWVARITSALDSNRLELWQQRIQRVASGGDPREHVEVLLRLRDEDGRLILPGAFLPAAERYDLAVRIDRWVFNAVLEWMRNNPLARERLATCAINLSGRTLSDSEFLNEVTLRLQDVPELASRICFEITETAAIANLSRATQFMHSLKQLGCSFSLDDFGSGLSSFAYLKNLPVDYVKIDGFFVKDVTSDPIDLAMVKAINDMTHAMGKRTIAEFVEDQEILAALVELGVDFAQGYGIARPAPLLND